MVSIADNYQSFRCCWRVCAENIGWFGEYQTRHNVTLSSPDSIKLDSMLHKSHGVFNTICNRRCDKSSDHDGCKDGNA